MLAGRYHSISLHHPHVAGVWRRVTGQKTKETTDPKKSRVTLQEVLHESGVHAHQTSRLTPKTHCRGQRHEYLCSHASGVTLKKMQ